LSGRALRLHEFNQFKTKIVPVFAGFHNPPDIERKHAKRKHAPILTPNFDRRKSVGKVGPQSNMIWNAHDE
jgi:hypothetical protein